MDKLRNCPFCGAKAEAVLKDVDERNSPWKVVANHDDECVFSKMGWWDDYESAEEAIEAWNRRADNV